MIENYEQICNIKIGSSVAIDAFVRICREEPNFFLDVSNCVLIGNSNLDYPLKERAKLFLEDYRKVPHLRPRTNTFAAIFKIRSMLYNKINDFFFKRGFTYINIPTNSSLKKQGKTSYASNLAIQCFSMAFSNVYSFGPLSKNKIQENNDIAYDALVVESEMEFCNLEVDIFIAEELVKESICYILKECTEELEYLSQICNYSLIDRLTWICDTEFVKIDYSDFFKILYKNQELFEHKLKWGDSLEKEHIVYLTNSVYKKPTFILNSPRSSDSFYIKQNGDKTEKAFKLYIPDFGEMMEGSQREANTLVLKSQMENSRLNLKDYEWYLDARKYGSSEHSGLKLELENLLMYITGINNIQDVIPFPNRLNKILDD